MKPGAFVATQGLVVFLFLVTCAVAVPHFCGCYVDFALRQNKNFVHMYETCLH